MEEANEQAALLVVEVLLFLLSFPNIAAKPPDSHRVTSVTVTVVSIAMMVRGSACSLRFFLG